MVKQIWVLMQARSHLLAETLCRKMLHPKKSGKKTRRPLFLEWPTTVMRPLDIGTAVIDLFPICAVNRGENFVSFFKQIVVNIPTILHCIKIWKHGKFKTTFEKNT